MGMYVEVERSWWRGAKGNLCVGTDGLLWVTGAGGQVRLAGRGGGWDAARDKKPEGLGPFREVS